MIAMATRHDYEIQFSEVDPLGLHVVRKDVVVVAGVEQDALSAVLDECGCATYSNNRLHAAHFNITSFAPVH